MTTQTLDESTMSRLQELLGDKANPGHSALRDALALHGLLPTSNAMPALYAAIGQCDFPDIEKNTLVEVRKEGRLLYSFMYADMKQILDKTRPELRRNGLAIVQPVITDGLGQGWLVTALIHKDGGVMMSTVKAPSPTEDPKDFGGILTFMRRYMLNALLCLAADDDMDNDTRGRDQDRDERGDYPAATKKAPVRRSAAPAPAADQGDKPAGEGISEGEYKNLEVKMRAMELPAQALDAMLARLAIPAFDRKMSKADWTKLKAELAVAAKATQ